MSIFKKKIEDDEPDKSTIKISAEKLQEEIAGDHITVAFRTDVGKKRDQNEDNYLLMNFNSCEKLESNNQMIASTAKNGVLLMVTDGMGGAAAGDVASKLVRETLFTWFLKHWCKPDVDVEELPTVLQGSIKEANRQVYRSALKNSKYSGMGATITAAIIIDNQIFIAQVGDSRCYLKRSGEFHQVTRDQSLVGKLVESGNLTPEEARNHVAKNVILQAIGVSEKVEVGFYELSLKSGDVILLCSDGLTDMVEDEEIEFIIANGDNLVASANDLVSEANSAGGKDNITVVLAKFSRNIESKEDGVPVDTVKMKPGEMWSEENIEGTSRYSIPPDEDDKEFTK